MIEDFDDLYIGGTSNCCDAGVYDDTDICMACKEHCEVKYYNDEDDENEDND